MIYIAGTAVFLSVILILVGMLLFVEAKVVRKGSNQVVINDDEAKSLSVESGQTLLSALSANGIFIPSGCGGGGACGMCKCKVVEGSRGPLPTELAHLSRTERQDHIRLACQLKVKENLAIALPPELLSIKKYTATVVSNDNVATFIKDLILELDNGEKLDFTAGAYIQIDIPEYQIPFEHFRQRVAARYRSEWDRFNLWGLLGKNLEPVFRAYSLANPPSEATRLRFTIRIATPPPRAKDAPPGTGSTYIFDLKPGDKVTLSGPFGEFAVKQTDREKCFVGGGAGMAPLRSQILDQLERAGSTYPISFWYGARSRLELFFDDEFSALAQKYPNFSYHVALSDPQPDDHWTGLTGFIHKALYDTCLSTHPDPTEIEYYLCGPPPMVSAVESMLEDLGVERSMIAYDKF